MNKDASETIADTGTFQSFTPMASRWLVWQCNMISDVKIGAVFVKGDSSDTDLDMLASWPGNTFESMSDKLYEIANDVVFAHSPVASRVSCSLDSDEVVCDVTALPLRHNNEVVGAVVFLQSVRSQEQKKAVFQLFQWGCTWLESTLAAVKEEQYQNDPLAVDITKLALQDAPSALVGHQICNVLVERFGCDRVALGAVKGLQVHLLALSNQLRFDKRSSHVRAIEAAMEESMDQRQLMLYPELEETVSLVRHKHHALSAANDDACILTFPFSNMKEEVGTLLLMRPRSRPFSKEEVQMLYHATELLGHVLTLKLRSEHSFFKRLFQSIKKKIQPVFGSGHLPLKVSVLGLATVLTLLVLFKTTYYTYAKSSLEGAIEQVIVAPYDGFIQSAEVRAGDRVASGQTLVRFNDDDLKLEYEKLLSEHNKITKEYREALALRERAKASILSAQIAQVDAQMELLKGKLDRSRVKAPFSGIVVSGDLSQSIGAPVEKGEQLFQISPLGDYRIVLSVDDHDISKLKIGQKGSLRLVGLPYEPLPVTVSRITPVASARQGGNYFRVEAVIPEVKDVMLRPGMQGIAKIKVGEDSILWVWTHSLFERLRLWFWSIGL
ncbi:HlyD family efflux transporter periplasmic adaptor subunit [Sulfurovum sp.]|uniref:efflux RND transporter periplasmic adaptor subunit n=1 Tax=Sulfurovum sp. TaxID=1969726 RepID=UPI0025E246BF|nr:HlyD family efflux transporter periplasmic adaptor subunit [Sulfurovum sp.]